jgi:hypothetical protein
MKLRIHSALIFPALAFLAGPAIAGSTATNLSVKGRAIPGQQVVIQATLTGNHIVWDGPGSVPPGPMKLYGGGASLGQAVPVVPNSTGVSCQLISDQSFNRVCHASSSIVPFTYTFPAGTTSTVSFYAHYDGDHDSDSSSSPTLTVTARRPSIAPVINMLFDN